MSQIKLNEKQLARLERFSDACRVVGHDRGAPLVEVREAGDTPFVVRVGEGGRATTPEWFALDQLRKRRR